MTTATVLDYSKLTTASRFIRVMIDSDDLNVIRSFAGAVPLLATYSDLIPTPAALAELEKELAPSKLILIDRALGDPTGTATIADVEPRAMTVAQLPEWTARKRKAGLNNLTGYCDRADLAAVIAIERHGLYHGVATLDGTADIPGYKALRAPAFVQILGADKLGVHGDLSLVLEPGWNRS